MKPFLKTLGNEVLSVPPMWIMRQAGRYLPEYRAVRQNARNFIEFCLNPELAIEVTLQPIRRYHFDAAIIFADILLIPHALGQKVAFVEGEGPKLEPIRDAVGLKRLSVSDDLEALQPVMETVKGVKAALPADVALIGFAGAPWTVATYMIEGEGGTDHGTIRRMAWEEPALFDALMARLVSATSAYLIAQAEAGAETLQIFDTWAGSVPDGLFQRAVIQPTAAIVAAIKARFPHLPVIGFPRGGAAHLAAYAAETGVDAIGIDHMTPMHFAVREATGKVLQGNLDPLLLLEGGAAMKAETLRILETMKGRPFIFNLGHGVTPPTPPDHVARLVDIVRGNS